jgi:hypothetical protein
MDDRGQMIVHGRNILTTRIMGEARIDDLLVGASAAAQVVYPSAMMMDRVGAAGYAGLGSTMDAKRGL